MDGEGDVREPLLPLPLVMASSSRSRFAAAAHCSFFGGELADDEAWHAMGAASVLQWPAAATFQIAKRLKHVFE